MANDSHSMNFHAGNFHAGNCHAGETSNFHTSDVSTTSNFHAGEHSNFHAGDLSTTSNFHAGNYHAGNYHAGNYHAGNYHAGKTSNLHAGNFHAGNYHAGNYHAGNYHAGNYHAGKTSNLHAGNFHAGEPSSFHGGDLNTTSNFHAGSFHAGSFHAGKPEGDSNFHAGNFHAGNFHAGNFHAGDFHAGDLHAGKPSNFHAGNFHAGNFHAGKLEGDSNFHAGISHAGKEIVDETSEYDASSIINFHSGKFARTTVHDSAAPSPSMRPKPGTIETGLSFYASTFDGKEAYNYVEKPANGNIYSNVATSEHMVSITDIRGRESELDIDRDAVLTISEIPDRGHTFTNEESIIKDFYPEVENILLSNVPGAKRVYIFDHTLRRRGGDRGPVTRAHIDQTPASALARVARHLPDEAGDLQSQRVRLINFWRPINGLVENHPLAWAVSGSVADKDLTPVAHHYPTWSGETYGVKYNEDQRWYYWSGMDNSEALLLQCFDSEKGGRLVHSAIVDPTSTSRKFRESIEVRALVFG
ncbi:hypothetical protein BDZ45DRAFT_678056 [Acephala macrosclerotiorum]|nr:hypothetical protein BDZ45DRAFT_678056 [Acephala macrosclerotiorum]